VASSHLLFLQREGWDDVDVGIAVNVVKGVANVGIGLCATMGQLCLSQRPA